MTIRLHSKKLFKLFLAGTCMITLAAPAVYAGSQVHAADAYDLSEYQGYLTPGQVKALKHEVSFVVLRAQNGGLYKDSTFTHNAHLFDEYNVPYGVYSYSLYANGAQARAEARNLHRRAPNAKFYANDCEENNAGSDLNYATRSWAREIHSISNRPAVLYSGEYFMNSEFTQYTRNQYDALWLAAYGEEPGPNYHYDLWQFSSDYYSRALGKALDADTFPNGNNKPLSFWIGNSNKQGNNSKHKRSNVKPLNPGSKNALNNAKKAANDKKNAAKKQKAHKNHPNDSNLRSQIASLKQQETSAKAKARRDSKNANNLAQQNEALRNENKQESLALQHDSSVIKKDQSLISRLEAKLKNKPASGSNGKKSHKSKNVTPVFNHNYFSSSHIHYLKVTNPGGINIYDKNDNHKVAHVKRGTIIHVLHFRFEKSYGKEISRAVGYYGWNSNGDPQKVTFTSNKRFVKTARFSA